METFGGGVAALGGAENTEEEERGKVEALPPLFEDEVRIWRNIEQIAYRKHLNASRS